MQLSVHSNVGKKRQTNQDYADYFKSKDDQYLFVLCDGVGGHQSGEIASELTVKYLGQRFLEKEEILDDNNIEKWIDQAITDVNQFIYDESLSQAQLEGMGTTLILAILADKQIYIAHVGDSRAYAYKDQALNQLTEDHSLVNELIRSGEITEEEGLRHPRRNVVTQSIGVTLDVSYELQKVSVLDLERLMLCSDGLTNMLSKEELRNYFMTYDDVDLLGEHLIEAANDAGGTDNITIILVSNLEESLGNMGEQA